MRPMWMEFPTDTGLFSTDNQWMVGDSFLVCPVTDEKAVHVHVYFPVSTSSSGIAVIIS